jgi:hypothetical protein
LEFPCLPELRGIAHPAVGRGTRERSNSRRGADKGETGGASKLGQEAAALGFLGEEERKKTHSPFFCVQYIEILQ